QAKPAAGGEGPRRGERRDDIIAAALEEFSACGFAATRLDDVARRAGVAKGTIYLYFRDKESLFQELVRVMVHPLVGAITTAPMRCRDFRNCWSRRVSWRSSGTACSSASKRSTCEASCALISNCCSANGGLHERHSYRSRTCCGVHRDARACGLQQRQGADLP